MEIPISESKEEIEEQKWLDECDSLEEKKRYWNDLLRNSSTGMMSWAEKNFKQKLIDLLYQSSYYKSNQTIYLKLKTKE